VALRALQTEQIDQILIQELLTSRLSSFFGLAALVLACIGLHGLLSHEVARRTREVGIRTALDAQRRDLLRLRGLTSAAGYQSGSFTGTDWHSD
jgi:ABC-type antimicrobial peptide transport system permease subunit